jgi:ribose-phosphate pyrophosphokinase
MKLVAGNGCYNLAKRVADLLHMDLSETVMSQFNDGEIHFEVRDHVRGDDVYIIQSTGRPANDNIMELAIMSDALKRSASHRIIAVIPYYGYSRQDRRPDFTRSPITSRLVAELLQASGIDYVVTMDIHSEQQQGFFNVPFINLSASRVLIDDIWAKYLQEEDSDNIVIVSPDVGGVKRARAIAKMLDDAPLAIIDKRRPAPGVSEVHHIVGDVERKVCIMVDDMVDTAGTLTHASHALKHRGAKKVVAYATHPVLSGAALQNIEGSALDELVVTDTNPLTQEAEFYARTSEKIRVVSIDTMLAEAIHRIDTNKSISAMYRED